MKNVTIQLSLIVLLSITGNQCLGQDDTISLEEAIGPVLKIYNSSHTVDPNYIKAFTIPLKDVCHALGSINKKELKCDRLNKIARAYFGLQKKDTCLYLIQLSDTTMYSREPRKLNTRLIKYCPEFNIYKKGDNVEDPIIKSAIDSNTFELKVNEKSKNNAIPGKAVEAYIRRAYINSGKIIWFDFPLHNSDPALNDTLRFYAGELFDGLKSIYVRNLKSMKIYDLITPCPPLCDTDSRLFFY